MNTKDKKKSIIQAGYKAVDELIKVAKEEIVDTEEDVSADRPVSYTHLRAHET